MKENKYLITKNNTIYTVELLNESFWEDWKVNREELKAKGLSPFKVNDTWFLGHFSKEGVPESKANDLRKEYMELIRTELINECYGYDNNEKALKALEEAQTLEQLEDECEAGLWSSVRETVLIKYCES